MLFTDIGPLAPWVGIVIALIMLWIAFDQRRRAIRQEQREESLYKKQVSAEKPPMQQRKSE